MKISVLTDDKAKKRAFLAEHGLSVYIEYDKYKILFDTGQSDVCCRNAETMGLELNKIDFIVLSHGHYDHCGGLIHLFNSNSVNYPKVFVRNSAFAKKYAINPDGSSYRDIGIPWSLDHNNILKDNMVFVRGVFRIATDIALLGDIPSGTDFEELPKGFFTQDKNTMHPDRMDDEQMLVFDTEKGLSIFLGCSHQGIINCLNHALEQYPGKKIDTLVAGMHLENTSEKQLRMTMKHILDFDIRLIFPLHCTGIAAISEIKRQFGSRCHVLYSGDSAEF
ncbi:MAG: MBL fold metallo-hydrolase [Eubacteriales bacterium]